MKIKIILISILSIVILFGVVLYFTYFSFLNKTTNIKNIPFTHLNNGDLVFRRGRSTESYAVYLADKNAEFTHLGIISIEDKIPFVIHIVPDKNQLVKKESLKEFLKPKNASEFAIYRSYFDKSLLDKVVQEANSFYLKKYGFDNKYDLETDSKLYCTELVLKAFKNVGLSLKIKEKILNYGIGKHKILFPSEFTKAPIFKRII
tara:strand:- start:362 stop:973 length:612 start_codon:yes stop_codon:yes gene_type:complete